MPLKRNTGRKHNPTSAKSTNRGRSHLEALEERRMLAAHIVGGAGNFATIQAAVNAALSGAVIEVDPGTYAEQVTISKPLTLRGTDAGIDPRTPARAANNRETILTGISTANGVNTALRINASDVVIDGFTIQGQTTQATQTSAAIIIQPGASGTRISNNIVQNNVAGIFLANNSETKAAVIQFNVFRNNNNGGMNGGRAIYTDGGLTGGNLTNVLIDNNDFTNNYGTNGTTWLEAAIAFEARSAGKQSNFRITNNNFASNGKAILFFNTTNVLIQGNTATGTRDWYSGTFRFEGNNHNVRILNNNLLNNPGPGVAIDSNGVPGPSSGFVINYNNIVNNGNYGYGSNRLGVVVHQNLYTGTLDVRHNWWGNANGPSGDGPGTGDGVYGNAYKTGRWNITAGGGRENFTPWSTSPNAVFGPTLPTPPLAPAAVPAGNNAINLTWTLGGNNPTGTVIERSLDGLAFTYVASVGAGVTAYADTGLLQGTQYFYRLRATNSAGDSANSATASATTTGVSATTFLSSMNWVSATSGWNSVQKDLSVAGRVLTLNGVSYARGLGTHAVSQIVYNLGAAFNTFQSDVGIDDGVRGTGSVVFQVVGDGRVLYDSGALTNRQVGKINISVAGVQQLVLKAVNGVAGTIDFCHANWANALLIGSTVAPLPPANVVATAQSSTSVSLAWTPGPATVSSYNIARSLDGLTFTNVGTVPGTANTWTDPTVLSPGTNYSYRVTATNAGGTSHNSNVATVTTPAVTATVTHVSDLVAASSTIGWGTIQKDKSVVGKVLTLNGQTYAKGVGTHADSTITYNLAGGYTTFLSDVGVDDGAAGPASMIFRVLGDGVVLYDSGVLASTDGVASVNLDVSGVQTLTLVAVTANPGDIAYCHGDWAGARLLSNPPAAIMATGASYKAPSALAVTVAPVPAPTTKVATPTKVTTPAKTPTPVPTPAKPKTPAKAPAPAAPKVVKTPAKPEPAKSVKKDKKAKK